MAITRGMTAQRAARSECTCGELPAGIRRHNAATVRNPARGRRGSGEPDARPTFAAMTIPSPSAALLLFTALALAPASARAALFSLTVSGTISENSSGDPTIPIDTPWTFELIYDTAAPDLDFELTGSPDPTFGRFTNTSAPPALTFFHYQAGGYEVTIDDPADFGTGSAMDITFTSVNAIDINVHAPSLFPQLAGGAVSFHADFNAFSTAPIFSSDGLPTNTDLGPESFDQSTVTLLPSAGVVSSSGLTSLTVTAVPEPSTSALAIVSFLLLLLVARPARSVVPNRSDEARHASVTQCDEARHGSVTRPSAGSLIGWRCAEIHHVD